MSLEPIDTSTTSLLPCPFCGSKEIDPRGWASTDSAGPACDDCGGATGDVGDTLEENIRLWNTRAPQWLPIESAPSQGCILAFSPDDGQFVATRSGNSWCLDTGDVMLIMDPTHWQPLPAPLEVQP